MKITTLNLQGFTDWQQRQPHILGYLKELDSDIVLFQEAVFIPEISPYNQVELLNQSLHYPHEHSDITRLQVGTEYETYREGLAFISKFPVARTDTIILKKAPLDQHNRIIQLLDVVIDGEVVKLANVHFSITDTIDFATAHLHETLDILAARGEERIIVGDFNLDHLEDSADVWRPHYNATTTFPYVSYPGMNKRNDYVLIPKAYEFGEYELSDDTLSDHRALTVEINLPLLSEFDSASFANDIDLDRTRILHGALDLSGDVTSEFDG
jgi:endonuclease/exonuclease/phosphatase family metal-dependent hydrolase